MTQRRRGLSNARSQTPSTALQWRYPSPKRRHPKGGLASLPRTQYKLLACPNSPGSSGPANPHPGSSTSCWPAQTPAAAPGSPPLPAGCRWQRRSGRRWPRGPPPRCTPVEGVGRGRQRGGGGGVAGARRSPVGVQWRGGREAVLCGARCGGTRAGAGGEEGGRASGNRSRQGRAGSTFGLGCPIEACPARPSRGGGAAHHLEGRVAHREDDGALAVLGHLPEHLLGEEAARTWGRRGFGAQR
jgi:hypothetical protein